VADFRRYGRPYDPTFTQLNFKLVEVIDLYGGGDPAVADPKLDVQFDTKIVQCDELTAPGPNLRRFRLLRISRGNTKLETFQILKQGGGKTASTSLTVVTENPPRGSDRVAQAILNLARDGAAICRSNRLPVSIMLAHAGIETTFGLGGGTPAYNNFHGITKDPTKPQQNWCTNTQQIYVPSLNTTQPFCSASTVAEGISIWARYVLRNTTIRSLQKSGPWTIGELQQFANQLPNLNFGNPSTISTYPRDVMRMIETWDLMKFDIAYL